MQNAKEWVQRWGKRVLSPTGLTFPRNCVLRPLWARFSLGMVSVPPRGRTAILRPFCGDFGAVLLRPIRTQQGIGICNAIKTTGRILSAYYKCQYSSQADLSCPEYDWTAFRGAYSTKTRVKGESFNFCQGLELRYPTGIQPMAGLR